MKRIVSIQDFSCIGKCSQSIALPVLSAMGIECACLPTALLSAHTAFPDFYSRDLTRSFAPITQHWKTLGLRFHAIYTGYLASEEQIDLVERFIDEFPTEDRLTFVDPVMADHGRLYTGFSPEFPAQMQALCRRADIITPNITEACLLTDTPYREQHSEDYLYTLLEKLLKLGVKTAILTGIRTDTAHMGVAVMDAAGRSDFHFTEYIPCVFHGTGDLFAATCVGALTLGYPAETAIALAADYVVQTIRLTANDPQARWYGVNFEESLPLLMERIGRDCRKEPGA